MSAAFCNVTGLWRSPRRVRRCSCGVQSAAVPALPRLPVAGAFLAVTLFLLV